MSIEKKTPKASLDFGVSFLLFDLIILGADFYIFLRTEIAP